jgi:Skp family chaperone for outer membrane proteins
VIRTWKFALACGLGALVAGLCPTPTLAQANQPTQAAPVQPCRVGFVNMMETLKVYPRYKALQEELKKKDEFYLNMVKVKNQRVEALQKEFQTTTDDKRKAVIEQEARQLKLEIETIVSDAKKEMAKYFDEQIAQVYLQFYAAVEEVAKTHGFDIVWRYNEDWTKEEYSKPARIVQRMAQSPIFPMFYDRDKYDLTYRVVQKLQEKFPMPAATTTTTTAPAGTAPAGTVVPTGGTAPAGNR